MQHVSLCLFELLVTQLCLWQCPDAFDVLGIKDLYQSRCSAICKHSEKAMATHSSTLAWQIPWMEEPGRLQSMGSLGVGHDWVTSLSLFTFMHWRRKWQPTPVFLPGESHGRGSLMGCRLWGRTELARLKQLSNSSSKPQGEMKIV